METKRNESNTNTGNNNAFDIGKSSQIEIYDNSGRQLDLSVYKEDNDLSIQNILTLS